MPEEVIQGSTKNGHGNSLASTAFIAFPPVNEQNEIHHGSPGNLQCKNSVFKERIKLCSGNILIRLSSKLHIVQHQKTMS